MNRVNLFVIGVNKAGTSWLYYLLDHHPDVFMADAKELYYFGEAGPEEEGPKTLKAYHRHFPFDQDYRYFGDATVMYYKSAATADEIQAYNPDAKLLAIVRDPIQRLLSQFQYNKQLGLIDEATSLSEALPDRRYLIDTSHYEETLPAYTDRFGADRFKVVSLEAGHADPGRSGKSFWTSLPCRVPLAQRKTISPRIRRAVQPFGPCIALPFGPCAATFRRPIVGCSEAPRPDRPSWHSFVFWGRRGPKAKPSPPRWRRGCRKSLPQPMPIYATSGSRCTPRLSKPPPTGSPSPLSPVRKKTGRLVTSRCSPRSRVARPHRRPTP